MNETPRATRRRFLQGGALFVAPLSAASVSAVSLVEGSLHERSSHLEEEAAIRNLHHSWLCQINAGRRDALLDASVRRITADHAGAPDRIEMAADLRSAVGYFDHAVEFGTALAQDSTLAQMAHAQGHGVVYRTERRQLTVGYIKTAGKTGGRWHIARVTLATL